MEPTKQAGDDAIYPTFINVDGSGYTTHNVAADGINKVKEVSGNIADYTYDTAVWAKDGIVSTG